MTDSSDNQISKIPNIKHLVMSGGVIYGFTFFGIMKEMHQSGKINMFDIQSIHATSAGSIIGTMLTLWTVSPTVDASGTKIFEWDVLENYLVHRPWQHVFQFSFQSILNCYQKCGIFQINTMKEILDSLFNSRDLDISTLTMQEFYDITHIELHYFTVELDTFRTVDVSYKTHPNWRVLDAVYASSCAPILFSPHISTETNTLSGSEQAIGQEVMLTTPTTDASSDVSTKYVDGGFLIHYPMEPCIQWCDEHGYARDSILGIHLLSTPEQTANVHLLHKYTLLDYFYTVTKHFYQIYSELTVCETNYVLEEVRPYEIQIHPTLHVMDVMTIARSSDERRKLIQYGETLAHNFEIYSLVIKSSKF